MPRKIRIQGHAKRDQEAEVKAKVAFEKEALKVTEKNSVLKTLREDPRPYTEGQSFPVVAVDGQLHRSADQMYVRTGGRWVPVVSAEEVGAVETVGDVSEEYQDGDAVFCESDNHVYYFRNGIWRRDEDMGEIIPPELGWTWRPPIQNPPSGVRVEEAVEGESMSSVHGPRSRVNGVGRCMSCRHWDYQSTDGLLVMGICTKNNTQVESDERPCSWAEPRNGLPPVRLDNRMIKFGTSGGFVGFVAEDKAARWVAVSIAFFVLMGVTATVLL